MMPLALSNSKTHSTLGLITSLAISYVKSNKLGLYTINGKDIVGQSSLFSSSKRLSFKLLSKRAKEIEFESKFRLAVLALVIIIPSFTGMYTLYSSAIGLDGIPLITALNFCILHIQLISILKVLLV